MKVVLSGIFYPMAILRYFEAALRRREDMELFTVGPYTGQSIPWGGGMTLLSKYAGMPSLPIPLNGRTLPLVPIGHIEQKLSWQPDLWLQIDAGWHMPGRPAHGKNVIVATDPHVLNYDAQRIFADTFYCMQTPYMHNGDQYLPYAYDPIWHAPKDQPQVYDVCLIGLHYQQRTALVEALRAWGLNVFYALGPSFDEAREFYNQAPIGLNWSSKQDLTARVFELLGMKRLAVVNRVPDLTQFFEDGVDLVGFDTMDEAVVKTLYYHRHPDEAQAIAASGHKKAAIHTWDARIETILGTV